MAVGSGIIQAQGDVNLVVVNQSAASTDATVQQHYQARITAAFQEALVAATASRKLLFVFDSWLNGGVDTQALMETPGVREIRSVMASK